MSSVELVLPQSLHHRYFYVPSLSSIRLLPSCTSFLHEVVLLMLVTRFFPPSSLHLQTVHLSSSALTGACALSSSAPHYVASPLRTWRPVTWHGLRG